MARKKPRERGRTGDGTVFQRADGKWIASISIGGRASRRQIRKLLATEPAANEALRKLRAKYSTETARAGDPPKAIGVYIDAWLARTKPRVREHTYASYETSMRLYVKPYVGSIRADRLRSSDVDAMMAALEKKGKSARIRELAYLRLRTLMASLVPDTITTSPVKSTHRARVERRSMSVFDQDQARAFLAATSGDRLANLYRVALSTGMRRGELLGLRWVDVDIDRARISVQHSLTPAGKLVNAKTAGSRRTIQLAEKTAAALAAQRALLQREKIDASPYVFPDEKGKPYAARRLLSQFQAAIVAANNTRKPKEQLPALRFHDLRHTAATLALAIGVHVKVVSEMLGHASVKTTLDLYAHVIPSLQDDAAKRLNSLL